MTKTIHEQVLEFHTAMGQPIGDKPHVLSDERMRLRLRLIAEEFLELLDATFDMPLTTGAFLASSLKSVIETYPIKFNMVEAADVLGDLDYVVEGTRIELGIDGAPIAAEIHRSNMAKLGPDGKPNMREDGKIIKPASWTPPDIKRELDLQRLSECTTCHGRGYTQSNLQVYKFDNVCCECNGQGRVG